MTQAPADGLRDLVAATVRDVVAEMVASSLAPGSLPASLPSAAQAAAARPVPAAVASGPAAGQRRVDTVRIESDADLDAFARHLLQLFENPKNRQDLRAGRHTFRLAASAPAPGAGAAQLAACRVEKGAVTERQVKAAAESQQRLVLGRAAVLTPLARERARALGVPIEKEH